VRGESGVRGLVRPDWTALLMPLLSVAERFIVRDVDFGILRRVCFLKTEGRVCEEVLLRETLATDC
jgi:hypothetical protein